MSEGFLARWSRLKRKGGAAEGQPAPEPPAAPPPPAVAVAPAVPGSSSTAEDPGTEAALAHLPKVEDLTLDSDYRPFMDPRVPEALRQQALRKLWTADPAFAAPDPLDIHNLDYAMPAIAETVRTAYKVGRGFLDEEAPPAASDVPPAGDVPPAAGAPPDGKGSDDGPPAEAGGETAPAVASASELPVQCNKDQENQG